jgi:aromatic-L-amino-acid decarboxylase
MNSRTDPAFLTEFEAAGKRLVEKIAGYLRRVPEGRVAPEADREASFAAFENTLGDAGLGLDRAVEEEVDKVLRHSMAMSHPLYLGLVNSSPFPPAALGDLLVSALDNNSGASHQGPAAAAAEREIIREFRQRLDYPGDGLLLPGGSYANLHAMVMARDRHFPAWRSDGPHGMPRLPRVYVADGSHLSIGRAATTAGFGMASIAVVEGRGRGEMDSAALQRAIEHDVRSGHQPFAVLATAGSTGTGAIDPLNEIADLCREHGLWLHIDACYGGAVGLIDRLAPLVEGMNRADSLAIDLHKWLFMPLTVGLFLTRHADLMRTAFRVAASYIPDDDYVEAYQRGIPTSRRSTSLAIWFAIRACGWRVLLEAIERNIDLTRRIESRLEALGFRVMPEGQLSIACARWEPAGLDPASWDELQVAIAERICRSGQAWFATTRHAGQTWLRINMVNLYTQAEHVEPLVDLVHEAARAESERTPRGAWASSPGG